MKSKVEKGWQERNSQEEFRKRLQRQYYTSTNFKLDQKTIKSWTEGNFDAASWKASFKDWLSLLFMIFDSKQGQSIWWIFLKILEIYHYN